LRHYASSKFLTLYQALPPNVRDLADKNFQLLKSNPQHPSLHFKRIGELWSVRVGARYRALGIEVEGGLQWIWIVTHAEYDNIIA